MCSVIGTTGTGKSSTIRQVTGQTGVRVSSSAESVTRQCEVSDQSEASIVVTWPALTNRRSVFILTNRQVFTDTRSGEGTVWIDTVGYDDTGSRDDEEIFRSILKFIQSQDLTKVNGRKMYTCTETISRWERSCGLCCPRRGGTPGSRDKQSSLTDSG